MTTLSEVVRSPRPDVNAVSGHVIRTLLAAPPVALTDVTQALGGEISILQLERGVCRAVSVMHYVLDILDSQLRIAESGGCGLLVVSVTGPFYPLLNVVRTLLHDPESCSPQ